MRGISVLHTLAASALLITAHSGCGNGAADTVDLSAGVEQSDRAPGSEPGQGLPSIAIPRSADIGGAAPQPVAEQGSPEWLIAEMLRIRTEPRSETSDLRRLQQDLDRRNRRIVALAEEAIAKTHDRPGHDEEFVAAVGQLLEARMQLALQNDRQHIAALYSDAAALHERDPRGRAAVLAGEKLVEFAREMARRYTAEEPRWLAEFARQARLFAANHPAQQGRAAEMLDAAAWSCEAHGLIDEALGCYEVVQTEFPETPQAAEAVAVVRRLRLQGRPLRLAGPTFDGGYIDLERDLQGRIVLVVFWDTATPECRELLPLIANVHRKYASRGLEVIGVSLDDDDRTLEAALDERAFPGPTIFHAHRKMRRWNSPIVKYYGVREIPMLWLVDQNGQVVSTQVDPARLDTMVESLSTQR